MKVGDLIRDFDGDLGVIVGWDGTNPMVYFTETVFNGPPGSYEIEKETVKEIVYEDR
jgi:hypothetical protein